MLRKKFADNVAAKFFIGSFILIIALMPVHTFFTTWLASSTGGEEIIKAWKELLLALNAIVMVFLWRADSALIRSIIIRPVNLLIVAYIAWHFVMWAVLQPDPDAAVAGIMVNGRFLSIFIMGQVVIELVKRKAFEEYIKRVFMTGAAIVGVVGTLQALIFDKDILTHFGYSRETVRPYMSLDGNQDLVRINSTLRGPNPLGSYLILPILVTLNWLKRQLTSKRLYLLLALIITLLFTFSRSAWLGLGIALLIYGLLVISRYPSAFTYAIAGLSVAALLGLSATTFWGDSYVVQTFILHDDPNTGGEITSNEEHFSSLRNAATDILEDPLGDGPGTAGPASRYNDDVTRIGENYYLQVGQEVGVVGLGLFLAINFTVGLQLWRKRTEVWPRMLFASFIGLSVISLFLHGWTDDATALTWWAFAGIYFK